MRIPRGYTDRTLKKYYKAHENTFHIRRFKDGNNVPPNIYGERVGKDYGNPIACLGYIETDLTDLRLEELGWHKGIAEIIVKVPFTILVENGLAIEDGGLNFTTDDLLEIPSLNLSYKLTVIDRIEPFVNGVPTYIYIGGRKFVNGS